MSLKKTKSHIICNLCFFLCTVDGPTFLFWNATKHPSSIPGPQQYTCTGEGVQLIKSKTNSKNVLSCGQYSGLPFLQKSIKWPGCWRETNWLSVHPCLSGPTKFELHQLPVMAIIVLTKRVPCWPAPHSASMFTHSGWHWAPGWSRHCPLSMRSSCGSVPCMGRTHQEGGGWRSVPWMLLSIKAATAANASWGAGSLFWQQTKASIPTNLLLEKIGSSSFWD